MTKRIHLCRMLDGRVIGNIQSINCDGPSILEAFANKKSGEYLLFDDKLEKIGSFSDQGMNFEDREIGEIDAPPALMYLTKIIDIEKIMADDTEPMEFATREEIVENFQVPKQSYVSCATVNDVELASCKEEGNYYIITIKLKDQKNPVVGKGIGAMFDVVEAEEVEAKAEGIVDDFTTEYYDCVVVAKFEKSTNRMVHANYMTPMKLNVVIGKSEASMEMSFEKDYTITY